MCSFYEWISRTENLTAISSLFVASASFWVSWLTYKRDQGRLDFYVGVGEIWGGQPLVKESDVIQIRIVNSGRRPLIVNSVGGDLKWQKMNRFLFRFFPNSFKPRCYLFHGPIVTSALMPNGKPRVLSEGENISIQLPLPDSFDFLEQMARDSESVYVFDSLNRKHKAPCGVMRKLRNDYLELKAKKP
jgi:hypothetical protein